MPIFLSPMLLAATAGDHTERSWGEPPRVVAHRGASVEAPENTLAAFRAALDLGAPAIELDVRLTADSVPVVLHDGTLDRTTNGEGPLVERTFDEVRELDAGAKFADRFAGERIPSLAEALDLLRGRALVNLELKPRQRPNEDVPGIVARMLRERGMTGQAVATSFDPELLRDWQVVNPDLACGAILLGDPLDQDLTEYGDGIAAYGVHAECVSEAFVAEAHRQGRAVYAWTVNDPAQAKELWARGVDGVITDDVRAMLAAQPG